MMDKSEILVSSGANGNLWNVCFWDFSTGTSLTSFKSGNSAPHTLSTILNDYIISAEIEKPLINVWSLHKKEHFYQRIVTPGKITALTVTPDGLYCIGAAGEKLHIWQISTGELLGVITQHYQPITCVKTTDDGAFVITAGEDNLVFAWKFQKILKMAYKSLTVTSDSTPFYSWTHNTLPVTDVHVGKGGRRARVVTVSLDHSCRLYSLQTGALLITFLMDISLTSTTMDWAEYLLFIGSSDGRIFQINLTDPIKTPEHSLTKEETHVFYGHSKAVSALAVAIDTQTLISGSHDEFVKIWNIPSRQCLRSLSHKGHVTNILLIPNINMLDLAASSKTLLPIKPFLTYLCGADNLKGTWEHSAVIKSKRDEETCNNLREIAKHLYTEESSTNVRSLILKVEELEKCNNELYLSAAKELLHDVEDK